MKRILAYFLALCMIFCLCACASDTTDSGGKASRPSTNSGEPTSPSKAPDKTKPPVIDIPDTAYEKLHAYIKSNGEAQDNTWVYTVDTFTMTAGSDGSIRWSKPSSSGTMVWELELKKDGTAPTWSVTYMDYSATATLEDDGGTLSDFQYSSPEKYAENMRTFLESGISYLLNDARKALEPVGLTLDNFVAPAARPAPSCLQSPPAQSV